MLSVITLLYPPSFFLILTALFSKDRILEKNIKKVVTPLALLTAFLGYSLVPVGDPDLLRYYQMIESLKNESLMDLLMHDTDFLYTRDLLFWGIAKIGKPELLAFFVGFIFYWIVFYILADQIERSSKHFTPSEIFMLLIVSVGTVSFFNVISNVRCVTAFAIITFASYRDLIQKRRNFLTYSLYLIPICLHTAAIIFIAIRLLQGIAKYFRASFLVGIVAFSWIVTWIYEVSRKFIGTTFLFNIVLRAINKAYRYLTWTEGGYASQIEKGLVNKVNRIYGTIFIIICILMLIQYSKIKYKNSFHDLLSSPMVRFLYIVGILAIGCLNIKTGAFWRFTAIFTACSPIFFIPMLESNSRVLRLEFIGIVCSAIFMLGIYLGRLLHSVEIESTLLNFISSSGVKIIYESIIA